MSRENHPACGMREARKLTALLLTPDQKESQRKANLFNDHFFMFRWHTHLKAYGTDTPEHVLIQVTNPDNSCVTVQVHAENFTKWMQQHTTIQEVMDILNRKHQQTHKNENRH